MRSRKRIVIIIAMMLLSIVAMNSCTHKSNVQTPEVSFSAEIIPILTTYCTINSSCHMGANSLNLGTNFDSDSAYYTCFAKELINVANPSASLLYVEVNGAGIAEMPKPPTPAIPAGDQAMILEWIEQGAKNN